MDRGREFRPDIEGLRAVAVLLVVAYHAGIPGPSGGYVGVDVFLVLSGYLITGILIREIELDGQLDLLRFYARRARRLLPALAIMIACTMIVGSLVLAPLEQEAIAKTALATSLYFSNFWFAHTASNYFAASSTLDPLLHTWSLAVEEQFYLVWPILILVAFRAGRARRRPIQAMAIIAIVSFAASLWLTHTRQPWAFFSSPTRAWEFAIGGAAAMVPQRVLAEARGSGLALLGWVGLATILLAGALLTRMTPFPGSAALLPVLGTAAVLVSGAGLPGRGVGRVLNARILQRLGQLSYGWYLWHWPMLVIASALVPGLSLASRILVAVAALGVAAASYRWVENPVRYHRRLVGDPVRSLTLAGVTAFAMVAGSQLWIGGAGWAALQPGQVDFTAAYRELPAVYRDGCNAGPASTTLRECVYGDTTSGMVLVLFGDSHAAQWFPAVDSIAREDGFRLVTMLRSACPAAEVTVFSAALGREFRECDRWRAEAMERIQALRPQTVIVASSMGYIRTVGADQAARLSVAEWGDGWRRTLLALDAAGLQTRLLRDTPRHPRDLLACLARGSMPVGRWLGQECSSPRYEVLPDSIFRTMRDAARGLSTVSIVDLSDQLCTRETCEAERDGLVVYRDAEHITPRYARSLTSALAARLKLPTSAPP